MHHLSPLDGMQMLVEDFSCIDSILNRSQAEFGSHGIERYAEIG
jgi:hypothetical protein